jgi:hypothetical protein
MYIQRNIVARSRNVYTSSDTIPLEESIFMAI